MSLEVNFEENIIFKYGQFKDLGRTLSDRTLGFSRLNELNDSFEASYNYVHHFISVERSNNFSNNCTKGNESDFVNKIQNLIDEELNKISITCFTRTPNEPLMWAHYAQNHTGVCYCFDKSKLFINRDFKVDDVEYSSKLPKLYFFEESTTQPQIYSQLGEVIYGKSDAWAYEKELRYYVQSEARAQNYEPNALVGIVLGCRISSEDIGDALRLIARYNQINQQEVKLYYSAMSGWLYEMIVHNMNITVNSIGNAAIPSEQPIGS